MVFAKQFTQTLLLHFLTIRNERISTKIQAKSMNRYNACNKMKQNTKNNEGQECNYQQCQYEYEEEYEDQYEDWNDYDDCDYDPRTNKITVTTYTSDKKPKHKTDPLTQSRQNAMRMVNKINNYNERKSRHTYKGNNNLYFVIVINGKQLFIGSIRGNHTDILYSNKNNFKAGKHNKGGQSAQRFGRIYDNKINSFIKQCVMKINKLCNDHSNGIILAGNGSMKNKLFQSKDLNQNTVKSHIIEIVNTQNGGKDGFIEIFQKIKNNQLFKKNGFENKSDIIIIKDVMALIEDDNKCDMISIGIQETIKAIKLKIIKYVVLTKYYKYVIKKKSKPIKFIRNDTELHESIESMKINISKKNKTWRIVDYVQYVRNLCSINNVELKLIRDNSENSKKFSNDLSGCVGVLYQSFEYLNDNDTQ